MKDKLLFNICPDGEFFGRAQELEYILERATCQQKRSPGIFLLGKRWIGKTEMLRRVHRELFWSQARVVPVYYQFKGYGSPEVFAEDFLKEVVKQYLAFRKRDPRFIRSEISLDKLERLLVDDDSFGLSEFIALHREAKKSGDIIAALRNSLNAPQLLTHRSGVPVYLILDDIDLASGVYPDVKGPHVGKELMEALCAGASSFLAAGSTVKALEGGSVGASIEAISLSGLDEETAASMMMELCRQYNLEFDTEVLTLGANKLCGNPMYIKNIIWAAHRSERPLTTLKNFVELYAGEVFEGNIAFSLRASLKLKGLNDLRVLNAIAFATGAVSEEDMAERLRVEALELGKTLENLSASGLIDTNLGSVKWAGDGVMKDFIGFVYETRVKGRSGEEVKTSAIRDGLKEGFNQKGLRVQGKLKEEIVAALKSFNGQKILKVLMRNQIFISRYKKDPDKSVEKLKEEEDLPLPQVIGCFDSLRWEGNETGPPIIIAQGFQNGRYDSGNEVIWITGVKDALSPVNIGDVESFIRRSLLLKENFRAARIVRWIVGREGFTGEALKRIDSEGIYSTDSVQLKILKDSLEDKGSPNRPKSAHTLASNKEFEVVIPASTKAELVAARAVEEIGTEMGFDENAIGQIKAALVEACINAFEHSRVKASKVFLRFVAGDDKLTIHVQNGGVDFDSPAAVSMTESDSLPRKRGWGFELMKGLMDEVRFEKLRGGAKIVLVKYLIKKGVSGDKEA